MRAYKVYYFDEPGFFALRSVKPAYIVDYVNNCLSDNISAFPAPYGKYTDAIVKKNSIKIIDSGSVISGVSVNNTFCIKCNMGEK